MAIEEEMQGLGLAEGEAPIEEDPDRAGFKNRLMKARINSRSIPGQGLLTDPNNPPAWERPPKYTNYDKATEYIFEDITAKSEGIINLVDKGVSLEALTEMYLTNKFGEGFWEPHLMMLLIEPTMYCIMFVCEVAGVEYEFEDEITMTDERTQLKMEKNLFNDQIKKMATKVEENVEEAGGVQAAMPESLLSKTEGEI